ncbi:unnamed protein product [Polarella glacialis]|uniref:Uncharacterized protein n=1 Tax=Polarella glacialis TaxID=89957 RepID=A0A813G337_POLGL|nr:unnamed protein product [Polarella glacialis]
MQLRRQTEADGAPLDALVQEVLKLRAGLTSVAQNASQAQSFRQTAPVASFLMPHSALPLGQVVNSMRGANPILRSSPMSGISPISSGSPMAGPSGQVQRLPAPEVIAQPGSPRRRHCLTLKAPPLRYEPSDK